MIKHDTSLKLKLFSPNISSVKKGRDSILNTIIDQIPDDDRIGFAGYLNKDDLYQDLKSFIFGNYQWDDLPDLKIIEKEIFKVIRNVITKCRDYITVPTLNIFIFPTQNPNVIEEMEGVNGFTPYKNTLHIYFNPDINTNWSEYLSYTVAHEVTHVISREKFNWHTILDGLIFEGLAEHFRECILKGEIALWANAISEKKAILIIKDLEDQNLLYSEDNDFYTDLFYGGKRFDKWSGYTVGYLIIEKILKSKKFTLENLLYKEPIKIFKIYKKVTRQYNNHRVTKL